MRKPPVNSWQTWIAITSIRLAGIIALGKLGHVSYRILYSPCRKDCLSDLILSWSVF